MLTVRVLDADARSEALADALSRLSCGVFAIDESCRIVFTNAAAEEMIGGPLRVTGGRLMINGAIEKQVELALYAPRETDPQWLPMPRPVFLQRSTSPETIALYFLPIGMELPSTLRASFILASSHTCGPSITGPTRLRTRA